MGQGIMINVKNGSGFTSLFHPTLPFSYDLGRFYVGKGIGAGIHSGTMEWEAPFKLNKPYFTIMSNEYFNVGSYYIEKIQGTEKRYRIYVERHIQLIDPRNGYITYLNPNQPLTGETYIYVGDIRG